MSTIRIVVHPATPTVCESQEKLVSHDQDNVTANHLLAVTPHHVDTNHLLAVAPHHEKPTDSLKVSYYTPRNTGTSRWTKRPTSTARRLVEIPYISMNWSIINKILLKAKGQNFFVQKIKETQSTVYEMSLDFQNTIVVCDFCGVRCMRDELVREDRMATLQSYIEERSVADMKGQLKQRGPLVGVSAHDRRQVNFGDFISHCKRKFTTKRLLDIVNVQFVKISKRVRKGRADFEAECGKFVMHLMSKMLLDRQISKEKADVYLEFLQTGKHTTSNLSSADYISNSVFRSKRMREFLDNREHEMSESDEDALVDEIAFYLMFNCYRQMERLIINSIVLMMDMNEEDKNLLHEETRQCFENGVGDVDQLPLVEGFVLEVFRLYPPDSCVRGHAIRDFELFSSSVYGNGVFYVEKNARMLARVDRALRDETIFDRPEQVNIRRYESDEQLAMQVKSFIARTSDGDSASPGTWLLLWAMKLIVSCLLICKIEPRDPGTWSGGSSKREGLACDQPLELSSFTVRRRKTADSRSVYDELNNITTKWTRLAYFARAVAPLTPAAAAAPNRTVDRTEQHDSNREAAEREIFFKQFSG